MTGVFLYSFWRSSCSWRVRVVLEIKKIDYEYRPIDIMKEMHQKSNSYSQINPMQKVPCLFIDGRYFTESYNIMQYLEETRPLPALLPKDPVSRSTVREICEIIQSGIQPLQNVGLMDVFLQTGRFNEEETLKWRHDWIDRGFTALERQMNRSAGLYSVGNSLTLADCFLAPQVYNATLYRVDMMKFPTISRVSESLLSQQPFINSHPEKQPDAPKNVKSSL